MKNSIRKKLLFSVIFKPYLRLVYSAIRKNMFLASFQLFKHLEDQHPDKNSAFILNLSHSVINKVFKNNTPSSLKLFYEENFLIIEEVVSKLNSFADVSECLSNHLLLIQYYWGSDPDNIPDSIYDKTLLKEHTPEHVSWDTFKSIRNDVSKTLKQNRKYIKRALKSSEINKRSEYLSSQFETLPSLPTVLTLITTVFFITSILYNQIYLRYFGIQLSKYFTLSDYLSSASDKIFFATVSLTIFMIIFVFMWPEHFKGETIPNTKFDQYFGDFGYYYSPYICLFIAIPAYYYKKEYVFYSLVTFALLILSLHLAVWLASHFKKGFVVYFLLWALVIFFNNTIGSSFKDIKRVLQSEKNNNHIIYYFSDGSNSDDKDLVLIAAITNYYFFYNKDSHSSVIIPRERVTSIIAEATKDPKSIYGRTINYFDKAKPDVRDDESFIDE